MTDKIGTSPTLQGQRIRIADELDRLTQLCERMVNTEKALRLRAEQNAADLARRLVRRDAELGRVRKLVDDHMPTTINQEGDEIEGCSECFGLWGVHADDCWVGLVEAALRGEPE